MEVYKKVRFYIEENGYKQLAVAQKGKNHNARR